MVGLQFLSLVQLRLLRSHQNCISTPSLSSCQYGSLNTKMDNIHYSVGMVDCLVDIKVVNLILWSQ